MLTKEEKQDKVLEQIIRETEKAILDSIPDSEIDNRDKIPSYQVWVFGLDSEDEIITENFMCSFDSPELATAKAEVFAEAFRMGIVNKDSEDITKYQILVETVIDFGDYEENIQSIYDETIEI